MTSKTSTKISIIIINWLIDWLWKHEKFLINNFWVKQPKQVLHSGEKKLNTKRPKNKNLKIKKRKTAESQKLTTF